MTQLDPRIKRVVAWVKKRGFSVQFMTAGRDSFFLVDKQISLNINRSPNFVLAILLHECGHLIGATSRSSKTKRRFEYGYAAQQTADRVWKVGILAEEMEAWHLGKDLACKLKIKLDEATFEKTKAQCLSTYIKWAANPHPYHPASRAKIQKQAREW